MNAAARLYEEYQQRLKQLQDKDCPHSEETDWMEDGGPRGKVRAER